jgi:hypothetical protein
MGRTNHVVAPAQQITRDCYYGALYTEFQLGIYRFHELVNEQC